MAKIKICGLRKDCDADFANEACPEYAGFVFAHSRREISTEDARRLRRNLRKEIQAVGVFVDEERERVAWLLQEGIIDIAQLHGREPAEYVDWLKRNTGCAVIKALHPGEIWQKGMHQERTAQPEYSGHQEHTADQNGAMRQECSLAQTIQAEAQSFLKDLCREYIEAGADYFLFDSSSRTQAGGTGKVFDWSLLPQTGHPFFLAGGLHAGNVEEAIRAVDPYAVDISSGVETDGCKDREKILEVVRRVRNV